jgi:YVTN family beta-propeller protein
MLELSFPRILVVPSLAVYLLAASGQCIQAGAQDAPMATACRVRQPVAVALADHARTLLVASRRSGSISVIDLTLRRVVTEHDAGRGLADLAILPDGGHLLAVDQAADELLLATYRQRMVRVVDQLKVSPDPVRLVVSADGRSCVIASCWSRRLTFIDLALQAHEGGRPGGSIAGSLDLPFSPRELAAFAGGSKLIVADAFGGHLALVDTGRRKVESIRSLPAHNIRGLGLAPDGRTLVIAHQMLNRQAQTGFDDIHWGLLISNHLRTIQTDALLKAGPDDVLLDGSRLFELGDVGRAAADPAALAFDSRGQLVVTLAGVDEVAVAAKPDQEPRRVAVGRRPVAVILSPGGQLAYVADSLDDTISVVDTRTGQRSDLIALGPRPDLTASERGERLFYSAKLSHDGWMSCHSCHTDGHTNDLLSDTLGDGSYGAPKRVPSLLGAAATGPWTWTGSISRLQDQVRKSIATTMHGPKATDEQVADLTAYVKSLAPPAAARWETGPGNSTAVARGREVFEARKCATCHTPPEYTSPERYDVGLVDEVGNRAFNPPSLRAVSRRHAFLHDGRARSLDDVLREVRHPRGLSLTPREIDDLIAFLNVL